MICSAHRVNSGAETHRRALGSVRVEGTRMESGGAPVDLQDMVRLCWEGAPRKRM